MVAVAISLTRDHGYDPVWNGGAAWISFSAAAVLLVTAAEIGRFSESIGTAAPPGGSEHRWL